MTRGISSPIGDAATADAGAGTVTAKYNDDDDDDHVRSKCFSTK